ncbi:polysaccharide pyruvyl transferase family protein [Flavimobilis marinus]|nr:polysaccharide pyruvyl transferase family protein [Flavimobilis marinus]
MTAVPPEEDLAETTIRDVRVAFWNPVRPVPGGLQPRAVSNFGDVLGPALVRTMVGANATRPADSPVAPAPHRLLAVGSVMHFARPGDHVWGSGVNGKVPLPDLRGLNLVVHAVRGPRTAELLGDQNLEVPEVFGDPALLIRRYFPQLSGLSEQKRRLTAVVPNLNDYPSSRFDPRVLNPRSSFLSVARHLVASEIVVGSSLHAIVVADAFGVPARFCASASEPAFKYLDYLEGTGRAGTEIARSVDEALEMGGHSAPDVDLDALESAFPWGLFGREPADLAAAQVEA